MATGNDTPDPNKPPTQPKIAKLAEKLKSTAGRKPPKTKAK